MDCCKICLKDEEKRVNRKNTIIKPRKPNEIWGLDILDPLQKSGNNNRFVIVAMDHYIKWIETRPLKTKDMINVANFIKEEIIDKRGLPEAILTDQGLEFI